ncbi:MAG: 2-oxoacid:acceptor oxidoreductase family protein [candidate division WOR-3 bacterium]|nr:2-oxoacid:acceptor oxidoreductase family protein [candidate division WOR-3 bacterium]
MTKIRIAGFGGQGIILAGELLANAAVLDGKEGSAIGSYGSAARGGLTSSEVIINNEFIDAPFVEKPDILIAMSQEGYDKYFLTVENNGLIIVDSGMVNSKNYPRQFEIPATNIALTELKSPVVANMIMLGALSAITKVVSKQSLIGAIKKSVAEKFVELNIRGIEIGYEKGEQILQQTH